MPFTPAHPAIILPFTKSKRFSVTALIAGSMVPDFEFFFQMRETENIGHHWYGVLLFDLPAALLFCYLFHNLLRNLLVANLPMLLQRRFTSALSFNWNKYAAEHKTAVAVSLFIGVASHLLWDGFTHHDGVFVELMPVLALQTGMPGFDVPVYYLLQIGCSIAGLVMMGWFIYRLPMQTEDIELYSHKIYWPVFILILSLLLSVRLIGWPQYNSFWGVFMAVMGGVCYSWLLVSICFKKTSLKKIQLWK